jgi:protein phosphatase
MGIAVPALSLVVLVGPSGSGKTTFARKHFAATEVLSSDFFRAMVADDETDQSATPAAFDVLHLAAAKRLALGKLTVIDATNVRPEARRPLLRLAHEHHVVPVVIVLDVPPSVCQARNAARPGRSVPAQVVHHHSQLLHQSLPNLEREGFRRVYVLSTAADIDRAQIVRQPLYSDRRYEHGPFDIVGDVHGCSSELRSLLTKLGYDLATSTHPTGRKLVFLGDLVDRGPDVPGVLDIVMRLVRAGRALCVSGNHEIKLLRRLRGRDVKMTHGLLQSVEQLARAGAEFTSQVDQFLDELVPHYVLDDGRLVVAHAGLKEAFHGRSSGAVTAFAHFGETTGERDADGLPVRNDWAEHYRGRAMVVYGHTPVEEAEWLNHTINVDTGCVFGGRLTALRYPERELVSVPAEQRWFEPKRALRPPRSPAEAPIAPTESPQATARAEGNT